MWESTDFETSKRDGVLSEEKARAKYGNSIRRAWTHKALNRLAQGSSADIIKIAMLNMFKDGLPIPINQVHDELNTSLPKGPEGLELSREIQRYMETAVTLKVPVKCDVEYGPNWGDLKALP